MILKEMEWAEVAGRQSGVITTAQLLAAGVSRRQVRWLLEQGSLTRKGRGLFIRAGAVEDWRCLLWQALLGAGAHAFACRRSAAALWGLDGVVEGCVEVGVRSQHHPRAPGVIRFRSVSDADVVLVAGVRATSAARTVVDLGGVVPPDVVERALECALRRELVSLECLSRACVSRAPGSAVLRGVLGSRPDGALPTESDAETLFVLLVRAMGLPDPQRQVPVRAGGRLYRLDFAWPEIRLAVEIDGAAVHGPGQLSADLRRQNEIVLRGWTILRFTWGMVAHNEGLVRRDLAAAWRGCSAGRGW